MEKVIIIGFGNQAKAWALNLRDSGLNIHIALRENSKSLSLVESMKFPSLKLREVSKQECTNFIVLTPDDSHEEIVLSITSNTNKSLRFIYAHGHSIMSSSILETASDHEHILLAPKSIASELRYEYETKGKVAAAYSLEYAKRESKEWTLELAKKLGVTCLKEASFEEETIADLFSEQSLLCSVLPYAALASYNTLRESGISKEIAFFECWHEVKLIANTLISNGPEKFFELISPNALLGSQLGADKLINKDYYDKLQELLSEISQNYRELGRNKSLIEETREKTLQFWKDQELSKTYLELSPDLY